MPKIQITTPKFTLVVSYKEGDNAKDIIHRVIKYLDEILKD